jgi:hypothetical protein
VKNRGLEWNTPGMRWYFQILLTKVFEPAR